MSEIMRPTVRRTETIHERVFWLRGGRDGWFRFPCDEDGNVDRAALTAAGRANLEACLAGDLPVVDLGCCTEVREWTKPALLRCDCRRVVALEGFTNACPCGRDYERGGALLAPREQWGEETGESLADILRIP